MHEQTPEWTKSGAPIAHVLNNEMSMLHASQPGYLNHGASATPFSGKLVDLLLDTTTEVNTRYRKSDDLPTDSTLAVIENPVIQLPKPRQPPKQTTKRPRIPPLLQGLHQPPPLPPSGRLFPPITEGVDPFERDLRGKADVDSIALEKSGKEDDPKSPDSISKTAAHPEDSSEKSAKKKRNSVRKRRKWSDQETRDLLLGVSRFGIGSWKKILQCEDFKFDGRTAVDLKDRFRVCCPEETSKSKRAAQREQEASGQPVEATNRATSNEHTNLPASRPARDSTVLQESTATQDTEEMQGSKPSKLAKFGIEASFAPNTRRPRRTFSVQDDENLWKGYEKYGAVWHLMRNDDELGFKDRHPTDLRDRFRIRYPETYASAGYKLKANSKSTHARGSSPKSSGPRLSVSADSPLTSANTNNRPLRKEKANNEARRVDQANTSKPPTLMPFSLGPLPSWLDDMSPIDDQEGSNSPIVLNRNILQWADSNSGPTPTPRVNISMYSDNMGDMTYTSTNPGDTGHIDPMATLNLPFVALPSQTPPSGTAPSRPKLPPSGPSSFLNPTHTSHASAPATSLHEASAAAASSLALPSKPSSNTLLRTPNLPTIVFPHVPVASARNAVHNLPTPADLLSGMDSDMTDMHIPGSLGDGTFGLPGLFGTGSSGHAPLL